MRSPRHPWRLSLLVVGTAVAGVAPAAAADAGGALADHSFALGAGVMVAAPAAGYGVEASAVMASGERLDLVLETDADGITHRVPEPVVIGSPATTSATTSSIKSECDDDAYHLLSMKWKTPWRWSFQSGSTPSGLSTSMAERQLKSAVASITRGRNVCGIPDRIGARSKYLGRTTRKPGVVWSPNHPDRIPECQSDDRSVVGFGSLPVGYLGLTCTTFQVLRGTLDTAVESDVLFNKRYFKWTTTLADCSSRIMLRSVATHEFGHVFGLGHVAESNHPNLTMSEAIGPCDDSAFTLGAGDLLGLQKRYPLPRS